MFLEWKLVDGENDDKLAMAIMARQVIVTRCIITVMMIIIIVLVVLRGEGDYEGEYIYIYIYIMQIKQ